jgi:5'-AMP-activated protein kinase catalytic alpha subunit
LKFGFQPTQTLKSTTLDLPTTEPPLFAGDLFDRVAGEGPLREPAARRLFAQLLGALGHCHAAGVAHRDVKPENVLLTPEGDAKLSDFGLGALAAAGGAGSSSLLDTVCGTPHYAAPEVLAARAGGGYDGAAADIWSLGVCLYVVLAGCLPFDEDEPEGLFAKVAAGEYEAPPWWSADAAAAVAAMLVVDPARRATLEELWALPWMAGVSKASRASGVIVDAAGGGGGGDAFGGEAVEPPRRPGAFALLAPALELSALLEAREELVVRRTRFTTSGSAAAVLMAVADAAVAVGGRAEGRAGDRLRLRVPSRRRGLPLVVAVEVLELLPGTRIVDVSKVSGATAEFYSFYLSLTAALGELAPAAGAPREPVAARAAAAAGAAARRCRNAFELLGAALDLGALLDAGGGGGAPARVQFSTRAAPAAALAALADAAAAGGGRFEEVGAGGGNGGLAGRLVVPLRAGAAEMRLDVRILELLLDYRIVQLTSAAGGGAYSMELHRWWRSAAAALAATGIMMRRVRERVDI